VRVDGGVVAGDSVTAFYDPLIAKLVVWGADRGEAIARMRRAVHEYRVQGIKTTLAFHAEALLHPVFLAGSYDTSFIPVHMREPSPEAARLRAQARGAAFQLAALEAHAAVGAASSERVYELFEKRGKKTLGDPATLRVRALGSDSYAVGEAGSIRELEWRRGRGAVRTLRDGGQRIEALIDTLGERDFDVLIGTRSHRIGAECLPPGK
jgi:acetyl/propionyl-CoA carboxylase alpha subunit